ncbi:MAG TPA: hypothetical protein VGB82_16235 [Alphaproteobacteria bacterium]
MVKARLGMVLVLSLALVHGATAGARLGVCAAAVQNAEREISVWPRCFSAAGLRQTTMIRLRAAARAAKSGDENLCWEHLVLSGYNVDCPSADRNGS